MGTTMKQLTIYCSRDLEDHVVNALDHAKLEGFLRIGGATGSKFCDPGEVPRTMDWEATMFLIPGSDESQIAAVISELGDYADSCETYPCLRMSVTPLEQLY
jgi:hypothetical protein